MTGIFRSGKQQEPERREDRELSAEEKLLAEKAKAAAAKRENERREQTGDVSDFLEDILGPAGEEAQPAPAEAPPPAVDRLLADEPGEPEQPERLPSQEQGEALAPFGGEDGGGATTVVAVPGWAAPPADSRDEMMVQELPPTADREVSPAAGQEVTPSEVRRRALSATLASSWAGIMAMGRSGEEVPRPSFEPEIVTGIFDRTVEMLAVRRRKPRRLEFEPEIVPAAEALQSAHRTVILSSDKLPAYPDPSAGPLPGSMSSQPAYSLDDLPALPADGIPGSYQQIDRPSEEEPALQEDDLDDRALSEALAAAEEAARKAELSAPSQAVTIAAEDAGGVPGPAAPAVAPEEPSTQSTPPFPSASPTSPEPVNAPEKVYSLDDLPQAPSSVESLDLLGATDSSGKPEKSDDDRLGEEQLPELPSGAAAAGASPGPEAMATLERAVDRSMEPGRSGSGASLDDLASGSPPIAADNAADLSIQQLADMEHYIENQVDTVVGMKPVADKAASKRRRGLSGLISETVKAIKRLAVHILRSLDRWLDPYCLSCKRVLGIAGVLLWAGLIAYILKVWVMGMHGE